MLEPGWPAWVVHGGPQAQRNRWALGAQARGGLLGPGPPSQEARAGPQAPAAPGPQDPRGEGRQPTSISLSTGWSSIPGKSTRMA